MILFAISRMLCRPEFIVEERGSEPPLTEKRWVERCKDTMRPVEFRLGEKNGEQVAQDKGRHPTLRVKSHQ